MGASWDERGLMSQAKVPQDTTRLWNNAPTRVHAPGAWMFDCNRKKFATSKADSQATCKRIGPQSVCSDPLVPLVLAHISFTQNPILKGADEVSVALISIAITIATAIAVSSSPAAAAALGIGVHIAIGRGRIIGRARL